jgi:hypothetical protein
MSNLFIQIDDEIREMTDEEEAQYLEMVATNEGLPHETPSPD